MSDYPMLISNKLHSFRNFVIANIRKAIGKSAIYSTIRRLTDHTSHLIFNFIGHIQIKR